MMGMSGVVSGSSYRVSDIGRALAAQRNRVPSAAERLNRRYAMSADWCKRGGATRRGQQQKKPRERAAFRSFGVTIRDSESAEAEGLEPPRACARRISSAVPYQLGLRLQNRAAGAHSQRPGPGSRLRGRPARGRGRADRIEVGETGFEPATPASRTQCSTRLSYSPNEPFPADGVGFEPTRAIHPTRFPIVRLKPLGHPSEASAGRSARQAAPPARRRTEREGFEPSRTFWARTP
jgi:hypothetical protein